MSFLDLILRSNKLPKQYCCKSYIYRLLFKFISLLNSEWYLYHYCDGFTYYYEDQVCWYISLHRKTDYNYLPQPNTIFSTYGGTKTENQNRRSCNLRLRISQAFFLYHRFYNVKFTWPYVCRYAITLTT